MKLTEVMELVEKGRSPTAVSNGVEAQLAKTSSKMANSLREANARDVHVLTRRAMSDLAVELEHRQLPPTVRDLWRLVETVCHDALSGELGILARDPLIQLAAWAITTASRIDRRS